MSAITKTDEALNFVREHGIVLEAAAGPVPSLSEAIAGAPITGSWWAHPASKAIFRLTRSLRDSDEILVCKAIGGKITYVHRRLWPALVRVCGTNGSARFDRVTEEHTSAGRHVLRVVRYPNWVSEQYFAEARRLKLVEAETLLAPIFAAPGAP